MKKFLLSLLLICLWIVNFSSASLTYTWYVTWDTLPWNSVIVSISVPYVYHYWHTVSSSSLRCSFTWNVSGVYYVFWNNDRSNNSFVFSAWWSTNRTFNNELSTVYFFSSSTAVNDFVFWYDCTIDTVYDVVGCDYSDYELKSNITESYCTNLYNNLIPVENVDQNYCLNNHLCPSYDCPTNTWDLQWSALFINNIQHVGAPLINISIPEEIEWDYSWSSSQFDLDIVWYNVDTEYVEWIIDVQNYVPTSSDFTRIFWLFGNYAWLLVSCLFIIIFFYFIKKLF